MTSRTSLRGFNALINWYRTSTPQRRRRIGVSLLVVCIVMLFTGNILSGAEVKTDREVEFELYSEAFEKAAIAGQNKSDQVPTIRLVIQATIPEHKRVFIVEKARHDLVLRVLVLMREARLFALANHLRVADPTDPLLEFSIVSDTRVFEGAFLRSQLLGNVKAETLLKLIAVQAMKDSISGGSDAKS